jgi:hypothetical protein
MQAQYSLLDRILEPFEHHRALLERGAGLTFSMFMSGVFSRLIKDPDKTTFEALLHTLGAIALFVIVVTAVVLFILYRHKGYVPHIPLGWRVYIAQGLCLLAVFLTGFFVMEAMVACLAIALLASGTLIILELMKDEWDIPRFRFLEGL